MVDSGRRRFLWQSAEVPGSWAVPQSFRRLIAAPVRSVVAGGLLPAPDVLDCPVNVCVSPRGGQMLCEDGDRVPQQLQILTRSGALTEFAAMNVQLNGERNRLSGDFRSSEWAGATFSPDGKWLFVNNQTPGITFVMKNRRPAY